MRGRSSAALMLAALLSAVPSWALSNVSTNRSSFNPSGGQTVTLSYELERPDSVTVRVYDMDGGVIAWEGAGLPLVR